MAHLQKGGWGWLFFMHRLNLLDSVSTIILGAQVERCGAIHISRRHSLLHVAAKALLEALHIPVQRGLVSRQPQVRIFLEVLGKGLAAGGGLELLLTPAV